MILIIGAGISGLTLAYELHKQKKEYLLLESSNKTGGYIKSLKIKDYLIELGPNSLVADSRLMDFLSELGLDNQLQHANDVSKSRFIFKSGKYRKLPDNPLAMLSSSFFSLHTKLSLFNEFYTQKNKEDFPETLASFFRRRFSDEIVNYALDPFVSGIYAGDVEKLLVDKTFPVLKKYENEYGSVLKGFMKNKTGKRKKTVSFISGMESITLALAAKVTNLELNSEVTSLKKQDKKLSVEIINNGSVRFQQFDSVVFTIPAFKAYDILKNDFSVNSFTNIRYAPIACLHTAYNKSDVKHPLNGFGGLNPGIENQFTLGSIWTSSLFKNRCPDDKVLFITFVGGDKQKHKLIENEDWELKLKTHEELIKRFNISSEKPEFQHVYRWEKALPQYDQHMEPAWKTAEDLKKDNLYICANWKDGVSLSDCINKAKDLAEIL